MLFNLLTADENYPFGDSGDMQFRIQMNYLNSEKLVLNLLFDYGISIKF